MSPAAASLAGLSLAFVLLAAGCESSQDKSKNLASKAKGKIAEVGVKVGRASKNIKIVERDLVRDKNGAASVIVVKNSSGKRYRNVPVGLEVKGAKAARLYVNDGAGLQPTLTHLPLVEPRERFEWVNDQVGTLSEKPQATAAKLGTGKVLKKAAPKISVERGKLFNDSVSGWTLQGFVTSKAKKDQKGFTVFAVARKGKRVVAAGRGVVKRLRPQKRTRFNVLFIGNPSGARLKVAAPPTTL